MLPRVFLLLHPRLACRPINCHSYLHRLPYFNSSYNHRHAVRFAVSSRPFNVSTRSRSPEALGNGSLDTNKKINVKLKTSEIKRLFALAVPEKWTLTGALGFLVISSSVTMAVPFSLGKVLDAIYSSGGAHDKLNSLCLVLCGVFLVGGLANFARVYLMSIAGQRMTQALRRQVFAGIMRQEAAWFGAAGGSAGELVNRLSADTQLVGRNLSQNLSDGLRSLFMVCAGTGMMLYLSPSLALVGLCVVPPVAVLAVVYGRFVRSITKQTQDALAVASKLAEEKISNIKTVKAFSQEKRECERYNEKIQRVLNLAYKEALAVGSFYGMTGLSGNTIIILVLYYGGGLVAAGELSVGALTSFLLYAAYVGISVGGLSSAYTETNRGLGAASRLWDILDRQPTIPVSGGLRPIARPRGELKLENVTFSYGAAPLLRDFSLTLRPGQSLALVGRSGCGKSTVGALLLRLYDPEEGRVLLDGVDIRQLDPEWLRGHIGYVGQEPVLFSGSIKENILYGVSDDQWDDKTDEETAAWVAAARAAQLGELLAEGGGAREVGARGSQLSGGQKQRVAIARAIVKDPKILILDEATSALDAQSEARVAAALGAAAGAGRTVLTVAHRLSTVRAAHRVAVMHGGRVVETGPYSELIHKPGGALRDLMESQVFAPPAVLTDTPADVAAAPAGTSSDTEHIELHK